MMGIPITEVMIARIIAFLLLRFAPVALVCSCPLNFKGVKALRWVVLHCLTGRCPDTESLFPIELICIGKNHFIVHFINKTTLRQKMLSFSKKHHFINRIPTGSLVRSHLKVDFQDGWCGP